MSANQDLAALAREREARRGAPTPPARRSLVQPISGLFTWKLPTLFLAAWIAFAWSHRSSCGCGKEHTLEKTLESTLSGLGRVLSGEKSFADSIENFGLDLKQMGASCESRSTAATCYISCRMAGFELQRAIWWECFKHGQASERRPPDSRPPDAMPFAADPSQVGGESGMQHKGAKKATEQTPARRIYNSQKSTARATAEAAWRADGRPRGRTSWPDVVGMRTDDAVARVERDRPDVHVQTVEADAIVTAEHDETRVRVRVDEAGVVVRAPRVG